MGKIIKRYGVPGICGALAIVLLAIAVYLYNVRTHRIVSEVSENFVEEKVEMVAASLADKFANHIEMLGSCATLFDSADLRNEKEIRDHVRYAKGVGLFKVVGIVGPDGAGYDSEGNSLGDLSKERFVREALKGTPYISDVIKGIDGVTDVIILSVPVRHQDKPVGVMFGVFERGVLTDIVTARETFLTGVLFLLTRNGEFIGSSDPNEVSRTPEFDKYFATDRKWKTKGSTVAYVPERIFDKDSTVTYHYSVDGEDKLTVITPIKDSPWVMAAVLPESALRERTRMLGLYTSLLLGGIILSFALLIFAFIRLIQGDSSALRHKENFELASKQNRTIVFDFDKIRNRLELSGSFDIIMGKDKESVLEGTDASNVLNLIHPDDDSFRRLIENADKLLDSQINAEARFRCNNGEYRWFRLKADIVRGHDGKVREIVGSMVSAEDNITRKSSGLKIKDNIDPDTGLYTRSGMERLVNEKLSAAENGSMYALYLIDIDNFSAVNDFLGHTIGDRIISDTARKIGRVFTDKDCIGRYAGDEFVVLLLLSPETRRVGQRIIEDKAYRLCKTIDETYSNGKDDVRITVSVGVSCFPEDGRSYEDLYRRADAALYAAKHSGKNQCCIYRDGGLTG